MRCGEPPPDSTGRCLRPRLHDARRLDVRSRRVTGHPTSGGRRNVQTTARPPDQRRHGLLLLVVVVGDPDEPTALWRLAALCGEGSAANGLFPATLSSVVGARWVCSSSLLVYRVHRTTSSSGGSSPAGFSIPGACDTYTVHRSTSPICNGNKDKSATRKRQELRRYNQSVTLP